MKRLTAAKLEKLEQESKKVVAQGSTDIKEVFGVVCPGNGLTHSITYSSGNWEKTDKPPTLFIPAKMEIALRAKTRFVIIVGGRGSGKSNNQADIDLVLAKDAQYKIMELRSAAA